MPVHEFIPICLQACTVHCRDWVLTRSVKVSQLQVRAWMHVTIADACLTPAKLDLCSLFDVFKRITSHLA